ncbi:hypothetical protein KAU19_03245 [Candidatus Parcubacteria bacterium]|nr:hypothetical protein [Candidatus Parcubacteria bacterium]
MNIRFKKEDVVIITIAIIVVLLYIAMFICFISTTKIAITKKQANTNNIEAQQKNNGVEQEATTTEWKCLRDDEEAGFYSKWEGFDTDSLPEKYPLEVIIRDKVSKAIKNKIIIVDKIRENSYSAQVRKCGIYVMRMFNYDSSKTKQNVGYKNEIWRYDYLGQGELLILLSEKPKEFISYYSPVFRVSSNEQYITLTSGTLYDDDYSLTIKDLNTKEDVFILKMSDIAQRYYNSDSPFGNFDMKEWTSNSQYFWGQIAAAANNIGYFCVDTENWTYEFYESPQGQMGGEKLNIETGWVTHHTDLVWTGVHQLTEELKEERREQGIGTKFYLYNLFTKKKILVYETDEPIFFTKPEWISDTEVEYELPNGEKKIYKLK